MSLSYSPSLSRSCLLIGSLCLLLAVLTACKNESPDQPPQPPPAPAPVAHSWQFSRDSAKAFIARQLDFGPRVPGTATHQAAANWLAATLQGYGGTVHQQAFEMQMPDGNKQAAQNIISSFGPATGDRLLLCAHWDSRYTADAPHMSAEQKARPVPGADDGASGVAVLLELARLWQQQPPDIGVDIVLFDAEDQGVSDNQKSWGQGAQFWARNPTHPVGSYRYGILLDMVGASGARFAQEGFSMQYAPKVVEKIWKLAAQLGYSNQFVAEPGGAVTDDHFFVNTIAGIPTIDIINKPRTSATGFVGHWHTPEDNLAQIDSRTLRTVGKLLLEVVARESTGQL